MISPLDSNSDDLKKQAEKLLNNSDIEGAFQAYQRCIQATPNDHEALFGLGLCQRKRGMIPEAFNSFLRVLELAPLYSPNIHELAEFLLANKGHQNAVKLLTNYLQQAPEDLKAAHLLIHAQAHLLEVLPAMTEGATAATDAIVQRIHAVLKASLKGRKLTLDTIICENFGAIGYALMLLPRIREMGYISDQIFTCGKLPNLQILKMLQREINIVQDDRLGSGLPMTYDWIKSEYTLNQQEYSKQFLGKYSSMFEDVFEFRHSSNGQAYCPPGKTDGILDHPYAPPFTDEEEIRGRSFLRDRMGIPEGAPFVCLYARDHGYHHENTRSPKYFRNSNIHTSHKALEFLVQQGWYVVRVGSDVTTALDFAHAHVVDYSLMGRDDFMDIYLLAKCRFYMGSPGGLQLIPWIYKIPLLNLNTVNVNNGGRGEIFVPKKVRSASTGEYILFKDYITQFYSLPNYQEYWEDGVKQQRDFGFVFEDCTDDEIAEATIEMWQRMNGVFSETEEDRLLKERYYALWPKKTVMFVSPTPPATTYLRRNKHLFFGPPT